MPAFTNGFTAVSTAKINRRFFAFFNIWIFLFKEGPAATKIAASLFDTAFNNSFV